LSRDIDCLRNISINTLHKGDDDDDDDDDNNNNNNTGNWNQLKLIQKIPEQRTGKARNQVTTENSHIGHSTHTVESTTIKVQQI
jgi:hypothetical protein